MTFLDFISPVMRRPFQWFGIFLSTIALIITLNFTLPPVQKYTIFFTVKPVAAAEKSFLNDGVESAEKIAEMIAGWAKSPAFQQDILKIADVNLSGLKRKMAARKQNRLNVFWTLKLSGKDLLEAEELTEAILTNLVQRIEEINNESVIPVKITTPSIVVEPLKIPLSWVILIALILGAGMATILAYLRESLSGRVSFIEQIAEIFPQSPLLRINTKAGKHDLHQINGFTETFEAPRLISTFFVAGKYFEITSLAACTNEEHTPILLINLGQTRLRELQNLEAILGDGIGLIVFEK